MHDFRKETVVSEFQRRRKRLLHGFGACMILTALSLAIVQLSESYPMFLGIGRTGWHAVAVAQFVSGVFFALTGFLQYRCPSCNGIPGGHDKYYLGVTVEPDRCPNCGTRLSESDTKERK